MASFIAALFAGLFVGTILCGFLADRYGRRRIFTCSLLWYSASNIMVVMQTDAFGLNAWRFVSGVGLGLEMVTIGAYVSELAPKGLRGRAFAVNQAIGFACVPIISFLAYVLMMPGSRVGVGGADRRARRSGRRVPAPRAAGKPALARQARPAGRGGPRGFPAIEAKVAAEMAAGCPRPAPMSRSLRRAPSWTLGPLVRGRVIL